MDMQPNELYFAGIQDCFMPNIRKEKSFVVPDMRLKTNRELQAIESSYFMYTQAERKAADNELIRRDIHWRLT